MKKSKIIIPALAMLVMSTAATVTGTVAWFSANKVVSAEGMMVKAQAEGSLVITAGTHKPTISDHGSRHVFNDTSAAQLNPSTHVNTSGRTGETFGTGLVTVTNGEYVNPETGSYNGIGSVNPAVSSLAWGSAEGSLYYKDYVVYVAGDGNTFTKQILNITLNGVVDNATGTTINNAISVDFYGMNSHNDDWTTNGMISQSNYFGTLNLAKRVNGSDDMSFSTYESIAYNAGDAVNGMTINGTHETDCLAITMRVYFDGNLIELAPGSSVDGKTAATAYEAYGEGVTKASLTSAGTAPEYVYKDGTYVSFGNAPDNLNGYSKVDSTKSTYRYARTVKTADIRNVTLSVNFSLSSIA